MKWVYFYNSLQHLKEFNMASWHCRSDLAPGPGRAGYPVQVQEQHWAERPNPGSRLCGRRPGATHIPSGHFSSSLMRKCSHRRTCSGTPEGGEYQVCMIVKLYWNLVEKLSQKRIWSNAVVQWSPCPFWAKNSVRESYSKFLVRFSHKVRRNYWTLIGRKSDNLCPKFETYFVSTNIPLPKTWWEKGVPPPESFSDCGFPNTG